MVIDAPAVMAAHESVPRGCGLGPQPRGGLAAICMPNRRVARLLCGALQTVGISTASWSLASHAVRLVRMFSPDLLIASDRLVDGTALTLADAVPDVPLLILSSGELDLPIRQPFRQVDVFQAERFISAVHDLLPVSPMRRSVPNAMESEPKTQPVFAQEASRCLHDAWK